MNAYNRSQTREKNSRLNIKAYIILTETRKKIFHILSCLTSSIRKRILTLPQSLKCSQKKIKVMTLRVAKTFRESLQGKRLRVGTIGHKGPWEC
jgi:lipoate synthase